MSAGPSSIATTTLSSGYALIEATQRTRRGKRTAVLDRMAERLKKRPEILDRRREVVEHPFGSIKQWMHQGAFLMRGLANVRAEFSLTAFAYNLCRALNILGVEAMTAAVAAGGRVTRLSTRAIESPGRLSGHIRQLTSPKRPEFPTARSSHHFTRNSGSFRTVCAICAFLPSHRRTSRNPSRSGVYVFSVCLTEAGSPREAPRMR